MTYMVSTTAKEQSTALAYNWAALLLNNSFFLETIVSFVRCVLVQADALDRTPTNRRQYRKCMRRSQTKSQRTPMG